MILECTLISPLLARDVFVLLVEREFLAYPADDGPIRKLGLRVCLESSLTRRFTPSCPSFSQGPPPQFLGTAYQKSDCSLRRKTATTKGGTSVRNCDFSELSDGDRISAHNSNLPRERGRSACSPRSRQPRRLAADWSRSAD